MTNENEVITIVEKAIKDLLDSFKEMPFSYYNEREIHSSLFGLLEEGGTLSEPIRLRDPDGVRYDDILIHSETKTIGGIAKRKKTKNKASDYKKIFDIVVLNPKTFKKEQRPLVAIEIKHNYSYLNIIPIKKDIGKLLNPRNKVKFGYFILLSASESELLSETAIHHFEKHLADISKKLVNLKVYFINVNYDKPKKYQELVFSIERGIHKKTKDKSNWKK